MSRASRTVMAGGVAAGGLLAVVARVDRHELGAALEGVTDRWMAALVGLALVNLVSYWFVLSAAMPGLSPLRAATVQLPATAISNAVPAGGAIGTTYAFVTLQRLGVPRDAVVAGSLATAVLGTAAKLAAPAVALVLLTATGGADGASAAIGAVAAAGSLGVVVLTLMALRSPTALARVASLAARAVSRMRAFVGRSPVTGWDDAAAGMQQTARGLVERRGALLLATTVFGHGVLFAMLAASVRAVGVSSEQLPLAEVVVAFAVARVASLIPLTPGGLGVVELSLTTALGAAGADPDRAVAAIVLYRGATYLLPTVLGLGLLAIASVQRVRVPTPTPPSSDPADASVPLVVDLDGTLFPVTTRMLMLARLGWHDPVAVGRYRRCRDRLESKLLLWDLAGLDLDGVPWRSELVAWVEAQRRLSREIYLASGAPDPLVQTVVGYRSDLFAGGWGSTPAQHLVGEAKADLLVDRFGLGGFDYVGDAAEDIHVWRVARRALLCAAPQRVAGPARSELGAIPVVRRRPWEPIAVLAQSVVAALRQRPGATTRPEVANP